MNVNDTRMSESSEINNLKKNKNIYNEKINVVNQIIYELSKNLFSSLVPFMNIYQNRLMSCVFQDKHNEIKLTLNHEMQSSIDLFTKQITNKLEEINKNNQVSEQINQLKNISIKNDCQLGEIQDQYVRIRDTIFTILTSINDPKIRAEMTNFIKAMKPVPRFFEEFGLAMEIFEQSLTGENRTDEDLCKIVDQLVHMKSQLLVEPAESAAWIHQALEIAMKIGTREQKDLALLKIIRYWAHYNEPQKALDVVKLISVNSFAWNEAQSMICEVFMRNNCIDKALDRVKLISDELIQGKWLGSIVTVLAQKNNMERAIQVVQGEWNEYPQSQALMDLIAFAMQRGDEPLAAQLIDQVPEKQWEIRSFCDMITAWLKQGNISAALKIAYKMQTENAWLGSEGVFLVVSALIKNERIKEALEVASNIRAMHIQGNAFLQIIDALLRRKEAIDPVLKIVSQIQVPEMNNMVLIDSSKILFYNYGDIDQALSLLKKVDGYEPGKESLLREIATFLTQNGKCAQAKQVAELMSEKYGGSEKVKSDPLEVAQIPCISVPMPSLLREKIRGLEKTYRK